MAKKGKKKEVVGQSPEAGVNTALGIGMLLAQAMIKTMAQNAQQNPTPTRGRKGTTKNNTNAVTATSSRGLSTSHPDSRTKPRVRTHDTGAADMVFSAHQPDGKRIEFRFAWKKRPVDAPESDWPTDDMGYTVKRPNGKRIEFNFSRKTRPLPTDDQGTTEVKSQSGLGRVTMEFVSSRPGRGDFTFVWKKRPPDGASD